MLMMERLQVQSRSPFEIHHILTGLEKTPQTTIEAELFLPEGDGPFGCVIAHHGSKYLILGRVYIIGNGFCQLIAAIKLIK